MTPSMHDAIAATAITMHTGEGERGAKSECLRWQSVGPEQATRAVADQLQRRAMRQRRGVEDARLLCAGPGRLGQALGIDKDYNGLRLDQPPFQLLAPQPGLAIAVVAGVPRQNSTAPVQPMPLSFCSYIIELSFG